MMPKANRLFHMAYPIAALALAALAPVPAHAEFFNDVRRTFQTDIPHFFQDDIPCAFGGEPTSHTKASCSSSQSNTAQHENVGVAKDPAHAVYRQ